MCYKPIEITNSSKGYTPGMTKYKNHVPCGHCDDCRNRTQDEWMLRIDSEIKEYNKNGGRVIFSTFTYDEKHVPRFFYRDEEGKYKSFTHFDATHKIAFLNKLRGYLYRKYGIVGNASPNHCSKDELEEKQSQLDILKARYDEINKLLCTKGRIKGQSKKSLLEQRKMLRDIKKTYPPTNKNWILLKSCSLPFRYMWASEYGLVDEYKDDFGNLRKGTKRPHYHPLFFIPGEYLQLDEFRNSDSIKEFFQKFWPHGEVRWSKDYPIFVSSSTEFASIYVSKYCTKSMDFYEKPELLEYIYDDNGEIIKEHYEEVKDYLPKHWQSKSFGVGLCEVFDSFEALRDGVDFRFRSEIEKGKRVYHRVPTYILRKLLYEQLPDGRYVLNEKGKEMMDLLYPSNVVKRDENLCYAFSLEGLQKFLTLDEVKDEFSFDSYEEMSSALDYLVAGRDIEVAIYSIVWRGLFLERRDYQLMSYPHEFFVLDNLSFEDFYLVSQEQYHNMIEAKCNPEFYDPDGYCKSKQFKQREQYFKYYSYCKRFENFEIILGYLDRIKGLYHKRKNEEYKRDLLAHKMFKSNTYNYG